MFLTACCHAFNPPNHLSRFCSSDEPPEFAPKMLSKPSFIIPHPASIILDWEKGRKRQEKTKNLKKNKKQPQITEIPIRTGLILSNDLCVWRNMVGNLWWNFYFTNYGTWQIRTGLRPQMTSAIITNYWRSPHYTSPVRIGLLSVGKSCIPLIQNLSLTHVTIYWTLLRNGPDQHTILELK